MGKSLCSVPHGCPCGYFTDRKRQCQCTPPRIQKYVSKISGPPLDRIDIHVDVPRTNYRDLTEEAPGESSEIVKERVEKARKVQLSRFGNEKVFCNAHMKTSHVKKHCKIEDEAARSLLKAAINELGISARAYDKILKVSRTIADLEGSETIRTHHISEAIQYRTLDRNVWIS
jgi:magnesium chelatase family protein